MADHGYDWLLDKAIGWPPGPTMNKIDTHHHFVPEFYADGMSLLIVFWSTANIFSELSRRESWG